MSARMGNRRRRLLDTIDAEYLKILSITLQCSSAQEIPEEAREPLKTSLDNPESLEVHFKGRSAGSIFDRPDVVVNLYMDGVNFIKTEEEESRVVNCSNVTLPSEDSNRQVVPQTHFKKEDAERCSYDRRVYPTKRNSNSISPRREERHRGRSSSSSRSRSDYSRRSPRKYNRRSRSGSPRKQRSRSPQFRKKWSRSPSRGASSCAASTSSVEKDDRPIGRRSPSRRRYYRSSPTPPRRIHTPEFGLNFSEGPMRPPFFPGFMPSMMHPMMQYVPMMPPMRPEFIRPPIIYNHRPIP